MKAEQQGEYSITKARAMSSWRSGKSLRTYGKRATVDQDSHPRKRARLDLPKQLEVAELTPPPTSPPGNTASTTPSTTPAPEVISSPDEPPLTSTKPHAEGSQTKGTLFAYFTPSTAVATPQQSSTTKTHRETRGVARSEEQDNTDSDSDDEGETEMPRLPNIRDKWRVSERIRLMIRPQLGDSEPDLLRSDDAVEISTPRTPTSPRSAIRSSPPPALSALEAEALALLNPLRRTKSVPGDRRSKVQTTLSLSSKPAVEECRVCNTVWNPLHPDDAKTHMKRHRLAVKAHMKDGCEDEEVSKGKAKPKSRVKVEGVMSRKTRRTRSG